MVRLTVTTWWTPTEHCPKHPTTHVWCQVFPGDWCIHVRPSISSGHLLPLLCVQFWCSYANCWCFQWCTPAWAPWLLLSESASTIWTVWVTVQVVETGPGAVGSQHLGQSLHQWALTAHKTVTGSPLSLYCTTFDRYKSVHTENTSQVLQSSSYHNLAIVKLILALLFSSFISICLTSLLYSCTDCTQHHVSSHLYLIVPPLPRPLCCQSLFFPVGQCCMVC